MLRKQKSETETYQKENYATHVLWTVVAFALFLLVHRFLGNVVFQRVKRYQQEYRMHSQSLDTLMANRFGLDYLLPKYIVEFTKPEIPVLLTPPAAYIRKYLKQTSSFSLTNPLYMFYMNSNVRIVSVDDTEYRKANCAVLIDKSGLCYPMKIKSPEELELIVKLFKSGQPYQPTPQ